MNSSFMHEVLKISDRFNDPKDPDALDRQGHLNQVLVLVVVFHLIMGISFVKMEEYERKHPRIIREPDVTFEFSVPPALPEINLGLIPKSIELTAEAEGKKGAEDTDKKRAAEKNTIDATKSDQEKMEQIPDQKRNEAAKVDKTPIPIAVFDPRTPKLKPIISQNPDTKAPGGTFYDGSMDDGTSDKKGKGGHGPGGDGHDEGAQGPDNGYDDQNGGPDLTRHINTGRVLFNIAPYRKQVLLAIAAVWHPKKKADLTVVVRIGRDGTVVGCDVVESSGFPKVDAEAVSVIEGIQFDPLPDVLTDQALPFKIDLANMKVVRD